MTLPPLGFQRIHAPQHNSVFAKKIPRDAKDIRVHARISLAQSGCWLLETQAILRAWGRGTDQQPNILNPINKHLLGQLLLTAQ